LRRIRRAVLNRFSSARIRVNMCRFATASYKCRSQRSIRRECQWDTPA
jgi:hypothetical protein